jgi:hypothetical protein
MGYSKWEMLADFNVILVGPAIVLVISMNYGAPWWAGLILGIFIGGPLGKFLHMGIVAGYETWETAFGKARTPHH